VVQGVVLRAGTPGLPISAKEAVYSEGRARHTQTHTYAHTHTPLKTHSILKTLVLWGNFIWWNMGDSFKLRRTRKELEGGEDNSLHSGASAPGRENLQI
jgi:hypothetical protein